MGRGGIYLEEKADQSFLILSSPAEISSRWPNRVRPEERRDPFLYWEGTSLPVLVSRKCIPCSRGTRWETFNPSWFVTSKTSSVKVKIPTLTVQAYWSLFCSFHFLFSDLLDIAHINLPSLLQGDLNSKTYVTRISKLQVFINFKIIPKQNQNSYPNSYCPSAHLVCLLTN